MPPEPDFVAPRNVQGPSVFIFPLLARILKLKYLYQNVSFRQVCHHVLVLSTPISQNKSHTLSTQGNMRSKKKEIESVSSAFKRFLFGHDLDRLSLYAAHVAQCATSLSSLCSFAGTLLCGCAASTLRVFETCFSPSCFRYRRYLQCFIHGEAVSWRATPVKVMIGELCRMRQSTPNA